MKKNLKIGLAGLGQMGSGVAKRLLQAGYDLHVYNRTEAKARVFEKDGAHVVRAPSELGECDYILTMLSDDDATEEVVNGAEGFAPQMKVGATHIAMSTISVDLSAELAEQHSRSKQIYIAAPVLGRPDAAAQGRLSVFASASEALTEEVEKLFSAFSQRVFHIPAPAWRAHLVKIACNFMLGSAIETMAEAFALTSKGGVPADLFLEIFSTTLFAAPAYKSYGSAIVESDYEPEQGFKMPLAAKDLRLVLAAADELQVPMPVASAVRDRALEALGRGFESLDWSALGKLAAENAGFREAG